MGEAKDRQSLTPHYSLIQAFFWMQFAVVSGFASVYLLDHGFTNTQIGVIIAVSGAMSAALQPFVAGYADRPDSPSVKRIIAMEAAALMLMGAVLLFCSSAQIVTGLFYGGCITFLYLMTPFVNALGMESVNQGKRLNFGVARGIGSLAYAVIAYILGILVEQGGSVAVPVSMIVVFGCLLVILSRFPFCKVPKKTPDGGGAAISPAAFFRKYRSFAVVLAGCVLVYISHALLNSFLFQIVESKGGTSAGMGFIMAFAAVLELPPMFLFVRMMKKVRCDIWFRISGIFFFVKSFFTLIVPNVGLLCAVQVFQMFGFALITVSSVYYVNSVMEDEDVIKGQAYMTMTHTLGTVLGALVGGPLIDSAGVGAMLAVASVSSFVGAVLMLVKTQRTTLSLQI